MKPVENETLLRQLNWRYATKKFDPTKKIAPADWDTLEQALVLSPSSYGYQPWKFFVVTNPAVRAELRKAAWNQAQVTDASHLVVVAHKTNLSPADADRLIARVAAVRGVTVESLAGYKGMLLGVFQQPPDQLRAWAARQTYIALGTFLSAAALLGVDACPMEGFDPAAFDRILGLGEQGYSAVVLAAAGYRADDDPYAKLAKVRFAREDVISTIG